VGVVGLELGMGVGGRGRGLGGVKVGAHKVPPYSPSRVISHCSISCRSHPTGRGRTPVFHTNTPRPGPHL
jgi:hypothetical protein